MIDYLIVFVFCTLFALIIPILKYQCDKILLFFLVALVLAHFSGLRYYTGWDFEVYQGLYDAVSYASNPFKVITHPDYQDFELGFRIFSLTAVAGANVPVFLSCILSVGVSFLLMHRAPSKTFGAFILLYLWYEYFAVFNIQRQIMAHAIILLGVYLSLTYNKKLFILASAPLAFTFHVSSIAMFVFYLISIVATERNIRINLYFGLSLVAVSIVLITSPVDFTHAIFEFLVIILNYLGGIGQHAAIKVEYYFEYLETYKTGLSFRYIEYVTVFLVAVYKTECVISKTRNNYARALFLLSLNISAIHIFMYSFLSGFGVIQERMESYFFLSHTILCSYLILTFPNKIKHYLLIVGLCVLFVFIKYYRLIDSDAYIGADSHYQRFVPYKNIYMDH